MEVTTQQFGRVDLVKASGRIDSEAAPQLMEAFTTLTDQKRYRIVFDMSEVRFLSSAGVWTLIETQKVCKRFNRGQLAIANMGEQIMRTVELAGLHNFFNIYETNIEAVGSL